MRFASLGSGSDGNALIVESGNTRVMLDCGLTLKETAAGLCRLGLHPEDISGIVVSHEHNDHVGGVSRFSRKYGVPVWMTFGTFRTQQESSFPGFRELDSHSLFSIGDIEIEPFPVPHDAREPVQFVFSDGDRRLGVLTDTGSPTAHIESTLNDCHALVLECNHDLELLQNSAYPPALIRRIAGRLGHLDNESSARLLSNLGQRKLQHVVAAHLSLKNNKPDLAAHALSRVLNCEKDWIGVADQRTGFDWRSIL